MNHKYLLAGVAAAALMTAGNAYAAQHASMEDQLKAQGAAIDALSKEVEALKNTAVRPGASKGVKGVNLTISGQINRAVMFVSDGNNDANINYVDNDASSTRVRWDADTAMSESTTVGARLEMEMESNSSAAATLDNDAGGNAFAARQAYVFIKGGWGTLVTGHQSEATDGILHNIFNYASLAGINAEYTNGIAGVGINFLGIGDGNRQDAIRYTTPSFGGFAGSVSAATEGQITAAVRYSGQVGGVGVLGGFGYDANNENETYAGSFGLNFGPIAVNTAMGYRDNQNANEDFMYYVGLAHKGNYSDMGPTSLGVDLQVNNGGVGNGDNNARVGVGLVQGIAPGAEAFVGFGHNFGGDVVDSAETLMTGMRIKF